MRAATPIRFVVGSRQLFGVSRELETVAYSLADLVVGKTVGLPPLPNDAEGYRVLSAPASAVARITAARPDLVPGGVHRYQRHYIAMDGGFDAYMAGFSGKTRSTLRRKLRKFAEAGGGALDLREYRGGAEFDAFLAAALPLSRRTYQGRRLGAGLPEAAEAQARLREGAADDRLRASILFLDGKPASYLCLPVEGETLIYAWLGYDPALAHLSPGAVHQLAALESLFAEARFTFFDFTEGEGAHKALFGTAAVEAASFFLLRRSAANRLLMGALDGFDRSVATGRRMAERSGVLAGARRLLKR